MNGKSSKKILLVEDEAITAMLQKKNLEKYGYDVYHVLDGESAVEKILQNPGFFELVLMDIDLGRSMDGTRAAAEILNIKDIPVVFLSSHTEPEIVEKTEKITSYGYVVKNSGITVLDASIKMAFRLFKEKQKVYDKQMELEAASEEMEAAYEELEASNEQLEESNDDLLRFQKDILDGEKALRESETKFRTLVQNLNAGVVVHAPDTQVTFANEQASVLLGLSIEQMRGKEAIDPAWNFLHENGRPMPLEDYPVNKVLSSREPIRDFIVGIKRPYVKNVVWVMVNAFPEFLPDGVLQQVVVTFVDITERKNFEEALEKRIIALTSPLNQDAPPSFNELFDVATIQRLQDEFSTATGVASIITEPDGTPITNPSNFTSFCRDIVRKTEKGLANCYKSAAALGSSSIDGPKVEICLSGGLWDAGTNISVGGHHIANWIIGQVCDEAQNEETIRASLRKIGADETDGLKAFREVPSMSREKFEQVARVLFTLAHQLSSMAYQNVQQARLIADEKYSRDAFLESDMKFRTIFENSVDAIGVSKNGTQIFANPAYLKLFGYRSNEELIGRPVIDIIDPREHDRILEYIRRRTAGEEVPDYYEIRGLRKDNSIFEMDVHVSTYTLNKEIYTVVILRDITERKQVEAELQEKEEKYRTLFEDSPGGILIAQDGKIVLSNPAMNNLLGYSENVIASKPFISFIDPEDRDMVLDRHQRRLKGENIKASYEFRVLAADDKIKWVSISSRGFVFKGKPATLNFIWDITEHKRAEQELQESETRFRALHNASFGGIAIHDKGVILDCNQGLSDMSGFSLSELIGMDGLLLIAESTRDLVMQNILAGHEKPYEAKGVRKNGEEYPLRLEARNIPYRGREVRVVEFRDLSEQKQAEKALRISDRDLKESQRLAHVGNWRLDVETNEVVWSEELYKMYGLDPSLPPPPYSEHMKLFTPESWERLSASLSKTIEDGTSYELELETVREDGSNGWMWVIGEALKNSRGETITLWGAAQDITEKKQAERIIKQQLNEKEVLLREVHHRIKNNINSIKSLLSLQADSIRNEEAKHVIMGAIGRVDSMRQIYDKLLLSDDYQELSARDYIHSLISSIIEIFPDKEKISVTIACDDFKMKVKNLSALGIIINELVTNSIKYAFTGRDQGEISISLKKDDSEAVLVVRDDGAGLPEGFDADESTGLGIILVKMLAEQLRGTFTMVSDRGVVNEIKFSS